MALLGMAPVPSSETVTMQEVLQSHVHELFYEKCISQSNRIYQDEHARQLRVQILLLEEDKDDLQVQLLQSDCRNDELEGWVEDAQEDFQIVEGDAKKLRVELRLKNRELDDLKTELLSLHGVSMDSTRLLTEKLALSRELATLRPEVEHLRSQAASCQTLLAEKLSLQRQLGTAQVEIETERRATQRALTREEGKQDQDAKLEAQIDQLQAELARERRERQKAERESQKVVTEFDGKKAILESRLDAFRNKLRMTKEQLKETQDELQSAQAVIRIQPIVATNTDATTGAVQISRKRGIAQLDSDAAIGTPGLVPAAKRNKRGSTLPGDKSTFSITPFLNRTVSVAPESPDDVQHTVENEEETEYKEGLTREQVNAVLASPSAKLAKRGTKREPKGTAAQVKPDALTVAKAGKTNTKGLQGRKAKTLPALEQVQEEDNYENLAPVNTQTVSLAGDFKKPKMKVFKGSYRAGEEPIFIKKKRKLLGGGLGKTIFDDDEGEASKGEDRGPFGGARAFGTFGRPLGIIKAGTRPGSGHAATAFGAFSPLKKDRETAGA